MSGEHDWHTRMMAIDLMTKLPVDHASAMAVLDRLRELVEWRGQCIPMSAKERCTAPRC